MTFSDWFDPYNKDHMNAYRSLMETGQWPRWFQDLRIKAGAEMTPYWDIELKTKMAMAWLDYILRDEKSS